MKRIAVIFFLLSSFLIHAQVDTDFPAVQPEDIPGGTIARQEYYNGDGLWGHINGGADVYLEYGFDKLLFQDISWNGISLRVEFYRMKDPEAAFGIYSISKFKCGIQDTISKFVCVTDYQVQSALGRYYISIANDKGTHKAREASIKLFQNIVGKSKEALFDIPEYFKKSQPENYLSNLKFVAGQLGLQNGFASWSNLFEGYKNFRVYILPVEEKEKYMNIGLVCFSSSDERKKFTMNLKSDPPAIIISKELSETSVLTIDSNKDENDVRNFLKDLP